MKFNLRPLAKKIINKVLGLFSLYLGSLKHVVPKLSESSYYFTKFLNGKIDCVLYVGANQAQYFDQLRATFPDVPIFLYEPDPYMVEILKKNLINESNYKIRPVAVGDSNETKTFFATSMDGNKKLSSSLLQMAPLHKDWSTNSQQKEEFEVNVVRLDDEQLQKYKAILLKIDVQGYELPALKGASQLLKNNIVAIDTEVSFQELYFGETKWLELVIFLKEQKFDVFGIDPWGIYYKHHGELLQADIFFVKNNLLSSNS